MSITYQYLAKLGQQNQLTIASMNCFPPDQRCVDLTEGVFNDLRIHISNLSKRDNELFLLLKDIHVTN